MFGPFDGLVSHDSSNSAFQRSDTGFACVHGSDVHQSVFRELEMLGGKAVRCQLLGQQEATSNVDLFVISITCSVNSAINSWVNEVEICVPDNCTISQRSRSGGDMVSRVFDVQINKT